MRRIRGCIKIGWPLVAVLASTSLALSGFLWLAEDVVERQAFPFDSAVLNALYAIASPPLTAVVTGITTTGSVPFIVLAMLVFSILWWRQRRAAVFALWAAVGGAVILNEILKFIFARPRPTLHPALAHAIGYSFPSGHSTTAIAFYGALAYLLTRHLPARSRIPVFAGAGIWIILVGLSRNYLGVHFPSDVIAAYAITLPWLLAVMFLYACLTGERVAGIEPPEPERAGDDV